jgi:hypothetical protein
VRISINILIAVAFATMAQLAYEGSAGPRMAYRFEWFEES